MGGLGRWFSGFGAVVPEAAEDVAAVGEVMPIRGEDFEGDCFVVAGGLKQLEVLDHIDIASAQREVQVGVAAFVVMEMNMAQAVPVTG